MANDLPKGWRVKPLEWDDFDGGGAKAPAMLIASYLITKWRDREFRIEVSAPGYSSKFEGGHSHPTLEAAKAAAQAGLRAPGHGRADQGYED